MNTPLSTPVRHAKLGISSNKSQPITSEYKKLLSEQYHRLWLKHQQDLDLIDDIRSYVKSRLNIEREYSSSLNKLGKQHASHIAKKFSLLSQCDQSSSAAHSNSKSSLGQDENNNLKDLSSDSRFQKRLANNGQDEPNKACSLYKVWSEHINRLQLTSKNRADQFEQLIMIVDKLKDIRSHKASIGKKCLDAHLKRIHEDILVSVIDVEKMRKLYHEDESQAKKARENEEKIKKKRSGILTKFTDLQAKKEKTSAQREANDIQSTQARNDYIMALAAGNAHLQHYYQKDLPDFILMVDDGVLDHCKIFMATLSECDINSLKDALSHAQYWSRMVNLTGSQKTNSLFLECEQSVCLKHDSELNFEPCNNDPIQSISLEHNADYALQHEIDKWFTWFKKECRNLSQLMHLLVTCQHAFSEGKKSIEINGQTVEDLESKIIELKQQIRKSEAAKLKAQARLKVIKDGGMQIEEWSTVESEIRADMAKVQEEFEARRLKDAMNKESSIDDSRINTDSIDRQSKQASGYMFDNQGDQVHLQISKDSDDSEASGSINHMASVSRSTSNLVQKQQTAISGYTALTDPSLVWQDDYSSAWGSNAGNQNIVVTDEFSSEANKLTPNSQIDKIDQQNHSCDLLGASKMSNAGQVGNTMTVQSSSPLSAIVDGAQSSTSPYPGMIGEAYKSDYECDYTRSGPHARSAASSAEPYNQHLQQVIPGSSHYLEGQNERHNENQFDERFEDSNQVFEMLDKHVVALYNFDKSNEDDLGFNEGDVLRVIEVSDANWVKARNEATGEEGFIPTSYIRLHDIGQQPNSMFSTNSYQNEADPTPMTNNDPDSIDWPEPDNQAQNYDQNVLYCRALYDYEPEDPNKCEDDGLPHLAIVQGELMRIIDQGEDDGWWLVEKESSNIRGHVPSMLVEEVEPYSQGQEEYDDGEASEYSPEDRVDEFSCDAPILEPPKLEAPTLDLAPDTEIVIHDVQTEKSFPDPETEIETSVERPNNLGNFLMSNTSFVIIEPTPEVESKRFEDGIPDSDQRQNYEDESHNVELSGNGPDESTNAQVEVDEVSAKVLLTKEPSTDLSSKAIDTNYEPLSEVDSIDMAAPPSVVIESCFDDNKNNDSSSNEGYEDHLEAEREYTIESDTAIQNTLKKAIKHSGNVDVSPILRLRAEEFSKQIIAEALMMAPGTEVGPSTSSSTEPDEKLNY